MTVILPEANLINQFANSSPQCTDHFPAFSMQEPSQAPTQQMKSRSQSQARQCTVVSPLLELYSLLSSCYLASDVKDNGALAVGRDRSSCDGEETAGGVATSNDGAKLETVSDVR